MYFAILIPVAAVICIKLKQQYCFYLHLKNLTLCICLAIYLAKKHPYVYT